MMTEMIAFNTKAAGPSLRNVSKADPITKSKTRLCPFLRSPLVGADPLSTPPTPCPASSTSLEVAQGWASRPAQFLDGSEMLLSAKLSLGLNSE